MFLIFVRANIKKMEKSIDLFADLLYYKYAIKTQVRHKPVGRKKFFRKEVIYYDNDAESPG